MTPNPHPVSLSANNLKSLLLAIKELNPNPNHWVIQFIHLPNNSHCFQATLISHPASLNPNIIPIDPNHPF